MIRVKTRTMKAMMMTKTSVMAMVMMTSMIGDDYYGSVDDCDDNDCQHDGSGRPLRN